MQSTLNGLFRNWPAICGIGDAQTRLAISVCEDPETLERLRLGFPECFSEVEDASLVPISAFPELSAANYRERSTDPDDVESRAECDWQGACIRCNIPFIGQWSYEPIPADVQSQVTEATVLGDVVRWRGVEGVVVAVGFTGSKLEFLQLALGSRIDRNA